MHKFLKILILITFLWAISLPWTLHYLSMITSFNELERMSFQKRTSYNVEEKVTVAIVSCGEAPLNDTLTLLKSLILSSRFYGLPTLEAILFADDEHLHILDVKVSILKHSTKELNFRYEIHPVVFPAKNHDEWETMFKPCASQRLFLHAALPHINEILYLDVDTLVVGDLREIWSAFQRMSSEQIVGIVQEHEVSSIGWYNRFAMHPYYPPRGLNTGVMLMNLTRLRSEFNWEGAILKSYRTYKGKLPFGDQDIINVVFHHRPDAVYLLPCAYNYRTDHCMYGQNCKAVEEYDRQSIQIVHGSRGVFHSNVTCPVFGKLYRYFQQLNMSNADFIQDVALPFKKDLHINSKNSTHNCDNISHLFFKFVSLT